MTWNFSGWSAVALLTIGIGLNSIGVQPAKAVGLLTPATQTDSLDMENHQVDVVIEDGYAITTIEQTFSNPHTQDLEATYSFPVPRNAAVSEFTYWIDGKPVTAEVLEKQKARQVYTQEKQAGRETGLAEQDSHKTFDVKVWPVRGGDKAKIRLAYIQPVKLDTGIGRYIYPLEEGGVDEEKLAFWTAKQTVTASFRFNLQLRTDYPVDTLRLPKHSGAQVTQNKDGTWSVHMNNASLNNPSYAPVANDTTAIRLQNGDEENTTQPTARTQPVTLDQDIVMYWRQAANEPARVDMVPYKKDATKRGTFMLTLTPGMDLQPITEGRDWVFVLDQSGSMGSKIATLGEGSFSTIKAGK